MANNRIDIIDNMDLLLLDTILESDNYNPQIQNTIDMTANYIKTTDFAIVLNPDLEKQFLHSNLPNMSIIKLLGGKPLYFYLSIIVIISVIGISFSHFLNNNSNHNIMILRNDSLNQRNRSVSIENSLSKDAHLNVKKPNLLQMQKAEALINYKFVNTTIKKKSNKSRKSNSRVTVKGKHHRTWYIGDKKTKNTKLEILGIEMPKLDYSMELQEHNKKYGEPLNSTFIPMGSFIYKGKTVSIQAFYAQTTEVTNIQWLLFLNYLIDNKREEELKECIPDDTKWAYKMSHETDNSKIKHPKYYYKISAYIPFSKKFIRINKLKDLRLTNFARQPIVGISYKAALFYADWLTKIYGANKAFRLPTEIEWEYMTRGGLKLNPYPWGGPYTRNSKGAFLANFLTSDLYYELNQDFTHQNTSYIKDKINYNTDSLDKYYSTKYLNKQNLQHTKFDTSKKYLPVRLMPVASFPPNNFGIYDAGGNAAEMIYNKNFTKGGSWASAAYYIQIDKREKWNHKPSDCVGFRLIQTYSGFAKKVFITPPGTVWLKENIFIDTKEVSNIDYREFLYSIKKEYGKNSDKYKKLLPDTTVWTSENKYNTPFVEFYFRHPAYNYYPVVGISYEQAVEYCKWRSKTVNLFYYLKNHNIKYSVDKNYSNIDIPEVYRYTLPTKEILTEIEAIKMDEDVIKKIKKKNSVEYNYKIPNDTNFHNPFVFTALVSAYYPNKLGLYNTLGNVAEMSSTKGIAKGGAYIHTKEEIESTKEFSYSKPERWLGFRCICKKVIHNDTAKAIQNNSLNIIHKQIKIPNTNQVKITDTKQPKWTLYRKNGYYGYLDSYGKKIVKAKYDSIYPFGIYRKTWALVQHNGYFGFIDFSGKEIVKAKYDTIYQFGIYQRSWAKVKSNNHYGLVNVWGEEVVKPKYDFIGMLGEVKDNLYLVKRNGYYGFIDAWGNEVIKANLDSIENNK